MIPVSSKVIQEDQTAQTSQIRPTKTYMIDPVNKRIIGMIEGPDALMQFIHKVMSTDKYSCEIYDWYYGNELQKLVGRSYDYVVTRIPNIFREALLVDDRITNVREFTFTRPQIDTVVVSCVIDTVYGQLKYNQEVSI